MNANMQNQRGIALIAALLLLLAMTILGLASMQMVQQREAIAGNQQVSLQAFHAADSSLVFGEDWIGVQIIKPTVDAQLSCATTPCSLWASDANLDFETLDNAWWQTHGLTPTYSDNTPSNLSSTNNRYVIEELHFIADDLDPDTLALGNGITYYRITSWGAASDSAESKVQSVYSQRY